METPCYNTQCLNRYLREQDEEDAHERAAEDLCEELYDVIEEAVKAHPLLEAFIDAELDALNAFLMKKSKEQIQANKA